MVPTRAAFTYAGRSIGLLAMSVCAVAIGSAQSSEDQSAAEYAMILQQIADLETTIAHREVYIGTQEAEINSLQSQIESVPTAVEAIGPMLEKMKVAIRGEIDSDLPFNLEERNNRLLDFEDAVAKEDMSALEKWRRGLSIYDAEVSYGQSIQAYGGSHPITEMVGSRLAACKEDTASAACGLSKDQTERVEAGVSVDDFANELYDGYYIRYGRLSLAYVNADQTDVYQYDAAAKAWQEVSGSRAHNVRRAMKMARGESAPAVVEAPIYLAN